MAVRKKRKECQAVANDRVRLSSQIRSFQQADTGVKHVPDYPFWTDGLDKRDSRLIMTPPEVLFRRLRRFRAFSWALVAGVGLLALWAGFQLDLALLAAHPIAVSFIVVAPALRPLRSLLRQLRINAIPLEELNQETLGCHSRANLDSICTDVARQLGGWERPAVLVCPRNVNAAGTLNSAAVNFVPRLNAIYLGADLLRYLPENELSAILAHELAHFHRFILPTNRNAWVPYSATVACGLLGLTWLGSESADPWAILGIVLLATLVPKLAFSVLGSGYDRERELACDIVAADTVGALAMANSLIHLYDRHELCTLFTHQVALLGEKVSVETVERIRSKINAKWSGSSRLTVKKARRIIAEVFGPYTDSVNPERSPLRKAFRAVWKKHDAILRWEDYDTYVRDNRLDEVELRFYLADLFAHPALVTHPLEAEAPTPQRHSTHPSLKKRLLYLYLHRLDGCAQTDVTGLAS